jgi:hypothetical protein
VSGQQIARRPWTAAEDRRLRELAPYSQAAEIGAKLMRSLHSVKHRARRLGISLFKHGDCNPDTRYSDALIEQARQMHDGGHGPRYIAKELGINEWTLRSALYYRQRRRTPEALARNLKRRTA